PARAFAPAEGACDEDRQLAERGTNRLDSLSRAARERRVRRSRPEVRVHKSADLHERMHERHLFVVKEGLRHTEKARARRYCASQADARAVEARPEQFAKAGETLCAACDPVGALDGSTFE